MADSLTFTYLNRLGGGFAERHTVATGTTIKQFLANLNVDPDSFTVRVVRAAQGSFTPTAEESIQEGDRLSCVPLKVEGASGVGAR